MSDLKMTTTGDYMAKCSDHPDAPHGFNRSASHAEGRYVCDCEGWVFDDEEITMNDIESINKIKAGDS